LLFNLNAFYKKAILFFILIIYMFSHGFVKTIPGLPVKNRLTKFFFWKTMLLE